MRRQSTVRCYPDSPKSLTGFDIGTARRHFFANAKNVRPPLSLPSIGVSGFKNSSYDYVIYFSAIFLLTLLHSKSTFVIKYTLPDFAREIKKTVPRFHKDT